MRSCFDGPCVQVGEEEEEEEVCLFSTRLLVHWSQSAVSAFSLGQSRSFFQRRFKFDVEIPKGRDLKLVGDEVTLQSRKLDPNGVFLLYL